jgi:hypothetical protein
MADLMIPIHSKPRLRVATKGEEMNHKNTVRSYRESPETVCLQIRLDGRYVSASMTFAQAIELGQHLIGEARLQPDELPFPTTNAGA